MKRTARPIGLWLIAALCWSAGADVEASRWSTSPERATVALGVVPAPERPFTLTLRSAAVIPMPAGLPAAHASALAALPNGDVLVFWWAGQRESSPDVGVYLSRWHAGRWSEARQVVDRQTLGRALNVGVRRIGNPAVWVAPDGRVHLYVVATGLGGWAAARVVQLVSADGSAPFVPQRILPLAPFLNTSVLVRTNPIALADGGWLLPAYFELGHKYPLVISFDRDGEPRWVRRIGNSLASLQPALIPVSATEVLAVMRDAGPTRRVQQAVSFDAGVNWQNLPPMDMSNNDSSVAGLRLAGGGFVLVHNDRQSGDETPRQWLRLSTSLDARQWTSGSDVHRGQTGEEFSYPSLLQTKQQLHVTYTLRRSAIAHQVYDIQYGSVVR